MASFKLALAAVAMSAVIISSMAEEAQTASLDGGYQKFPSRVRREDGVPSLSGVSDGIQNPSGYGQQFQQYATQFGNAPNPGMNPSEYMKPQEWANKFSQYVPGGNKEIS